MAVQSKNNSNAEATTTNNDNLETTEIEEK
jgi:hypothetical protein